MIVPSGGAFQLPDELFCLYQSVGIVSELSDERGVCLKNGTHHNSMPDLSNNYGKHKKQSHTNDIEF
ncbi:MAG: hypothetical protein A2W05_05620 [Candidatus Schekmanbacteria bacterium RBG_16_38_10]|uniref:Uncharacterized protein n=1 Tax=Candidatus Schekmanbacteria bacterium RBG_16_38_10 TaxID=1817879 RepID=A0A1F7RVV9_9BACT|nr:MAG: hypothetical protein A2W05_05620 [Candidatus Schekmanbacteria bacterium RBG_16_38_10]